MLFTYQGKNILFFHENPCIYSNLTKKCHLIFCIRLRRIYFMNSQKKTVYIRNIYTHSIIYTFIVFLSSTIFQIFTNRVLCRYELFLANNYDELLLSLFSAQVTIIILPLSLFGIFTEISNEVYLGQPIAEYMYMYKGNHFFAFTYKELAVNSLLLTLVEYILMSKELLAAELMILVLNTTAMLVSLFSWFEVRIKKEEFHTYIQKQIYTTIDIYMKQGTGRTYIIKLLSKLKDWVVNGGDFELVEAMEFYKNLNIHSIFWDISNPAQNTEKKELVKEFSLSYENTDSYFDEMVADLLRKQDYYRALRCSNGILETVARYRVNSYYHPTHYHYHILLNLFRKMSEMEIELLGSNWICNYLIVILKNGTAENCFAPNAEAEKSKDYEELQCITEENYILVYEFLMSIWRNENLSLEYKQKQLKDFLSMSIFHSNINDSALCVKMKLMETKEQKIIDIVMKSTWTQIAYSFIGYDLSTETKDQEFLKKSMVLIASYSYYLAAHTNQNITIPQLKSYTLNTKIGITETHYLWEVLAEFAWKCLDENSALLSKNYKLDHIFQYKYHAVICEIMLYSAMAYKQWPILTKNNIDIYDQVIYFFRYITGSNKLLAAAISRYKRFIDLFKSRYEITDQLINDQFYELKKEILQYYMEPLKKSAERLNKNAFLEDIKRKVWDELLADHRFEPNSSYVQISSDDSVYEATFECLYLILPNEKTFDANEIKEWLCGHLLQRNTVIKETSDQKQSRKYIVLSLYWKDETLNDSEIEFFIKKEAGFNVGFLFYPKISILSMNFRTYEEAHEFLTLNYKKIVFRMKVKIENQKKEAVE